MTISIHRGRQFMGDEAGPVPLFEADGKLGPYVKLMAEKMVAQETSVRLVDGSGQAVTLKTSDDWAQFFDKHLPDADASKNLGATFGVSFAGLVNIMDDVASGTERGVALDLARESTLSVSLKLTSEKDEYAIGLTKGQEIDLQVMSTEFLVREAFLLSEGIKEAKDIPPSQGAVKMPGIRQFIDGVKTGQQIEGNFRQAWPITEAVNLYAAAVRSGKTLKYDASQLKITNVPEANKYLDREYRAGWELDKI